MAQKLETVLRARVSRHLKNLPNTWMESIQQVSIMGSPDMLLCVLGHFVAIEFKATPKDQLTPMQAYKREVIVNKAKGLYFIIDNQNWQCVVQFLRVLAVTPIGENDV